MGFDVFPARYLDKTISFYYNDKTLLITIFLLIKLKEINSVIFGSSSQNCIKLYYYQMNIEFLSVFKKFEN